MNKIDRVSEVNKIDRVDGMDKIDTEDRDNKIDRVDRDNKIDREDRVNDLVLSQSSEKHMADRVRGGLHRNPGASHFEGSHLSLK